ncbi:Speedy protein A [Halotydeus destructor]|nr:Speedy protein A [Halotydeus destructor]
MEWNSSRQKVVWFTQAEKDAVFALMQSVDLQLLLENDRCYMVADSYLLAMALVYLKRANYETNKYTFTNYMVALYLAHEVCEDDLDLKLDIVRTVFSDHPQGDFGRHCQKLFILRRTKLWQELKYNVLVSKAECELVMQHVLPGNYLWRRLRSEHHGGAALTFRIKEQVYFGGQFRTSHNSFRCLICEGLRYKACRQREQFKAIEAIARQLLPYERHRRGHVRSQGCRVNAIPLFYGQQQVDHYYQKMSRG